MAERRYTSPCGMIVAGGTRERGLSSVRQSILTFLLLALCAAAIEPAQAADEASPAPSENKPAISYIVKTEVMPQGGRTCFNVVSIGRLVPEIYVVGSPKRVVIDAGDVLFRLPQRQQKMAGGVVGAFRYGLIAPGRARIVVDVEEGTQVGRISSKVLSGKMHQLSINLSSGAAEEPEKACDETSGELQQAAVWGGHLSVKPVKPAKPTKKSKPVVMIDPGHGGVDPGAVVNKVYLEKIIALAVARRLAARLRKNGRFDVIMTRKRDVFVSLDDRVEQARSKKASVFISLHADSINDAAQASQTQGAAVYILSHEASDAEAKRLADKENSADLLAGILPKKGDQNDGVRDILVDLLKRETEQGSARLRKLLIGAMRAKVPVSRKPFRSAAFRVLKQTETPAALIELGYMTNPCGSYTNATGGVAERDGSRDCRCYWSVFQ